MTPTVTPTVTSRAAAALTVSGSLARARATRRSFYVCTQGGIDVTVAAEPPRRPSSGSSSHLVSSKGVLVAQVGPAGSFGSSALLRADAPVKATSTAAVDSEVPRLGSKRGSSAQA